MPEGTPYFSTLYDLLLCMTRAIDLVSPAVTNHHQQVAYLSYGIADVLQLPMEQKRSLIIAALLHDVGAIALHDKLKGKNTPASMTMLLLGQNCLPISQFLQTYR